MKKLTLVVALMTAVIASNAQGLRIGLAGGFNSTWLFNKTVSDAGDELDYKSSFGGQFGIAALYNFKENIGISLDVLYNSVNQKYTLRAGNTTYETETSLNLISMPLLFRYTGEKGPYFEIGPEFSILSGGTISRDAVPSLGLAAYEADIEGEELAGLNIAAVLGFGVDIKASEQLTITAGLRFAWGFTDVNSDDYKKEVEAGGGKYESTNTAVGGLHLGIAYKLGSDSSK